MCAPRVTRHTSIRYLSSCHTRVNIGASIFFTAAMIPAFRSARSRGNGGTNTRSLTYPPPPQKKSRKYVSYGFPIINFCNSGVHYRVCCSPPLIPILSHMNPLSSCTVQDRELMSYTSLLHYGSLLLRDWCVTWAMSLYRSVNFILTFTLQSFEHSKRCKSA
jgi:hypothetical protein